jgi:hypothetical protein
MKKPHVHAEVIKAWADGAEIEFRQEECHMWKKVDYPTWNVHNQYRVKPEPVVKYHGIMQGTDKFGLMNHNTGYYSEISHVYSHDIKWKIIAIVKTTFVDNVPVSIEIVKEIK